jgi:hypothetical protein
MNKWFRRVPVVVLAAVFALAMPLSGDEESKTPKPKGLGKTAQDRKAVEVRFIDDSTLKVALGDARLELVTPYGKLLIPVVDIQRIDFGFHFPAGLPKRIETLIEDLGAKEFRKREAASADLLELRDKAYRHLLQAEKHKDPEVARRAEDLLNKIRELAPAELLEAPTNDVVYTEDSKIAGQITATTLRVTTFQFGEQQLKLADLRSLRSLSAGSDLANALDPGQLSALGNQVGKTFSFQVTGVPQRNFGGSLWGSDIYTLDSPLALAAVHAGVLRPGQTGAVRVTILGTQAQFQGSTRHGITSMPYGAWSGYRINK